MNINSAYFDMEQLCSFLNSDMKDSTFDYTCLHLNIQSLPAKFDALKLLIHELHEKNIDLDFIMLCETFLRDDIAPHFEIPGYNCVYHSRPNASRGCVAIYINTKYNFNKRDDMSINVPGSFESIFIEIQSTHLKDLVGEIYRVPNTNEANYLAMYENILKNLQNYKHNIIIGTDQNFDYIKLEQHKNTDTLLGTFQAQFSLSNVHKRGLKHHHFISFGAAHLISRGGFVNFRKKLSGFHLLKHKLSGSHVERRATNFMA